MRDNFKKHLKALMSIAIAFAMLLSDGVSAWADNGSNNLVESEIVGALPGGELSLNSFLWPDDQGRYTVEKTTGILEGNEYLLVVTAGILTDSADITIDNISQSTLYLDQKQGTSTGVAFENFTPISDEDATVILAGEGMAPEIIGYISKDAVKFAGYFENEACTIPVVNVYERGGTYSEATIAESLPAVVYANFVINGGSSVSVPVNFDWNCVEGTVKAGEALTYVADATITEQGISDRISSILYPFTVKVYITDDEATASYITATKGRIIYNIGDTITDEDVLVSAVCSDGTIRFVTEGFTTNAGSLSTTKAGTKKLEITMGSLKTTIQLTVLSAKAKPTFQVNFNSMGGTYVAPLAVTGALKAFSGNPYKNGYDFTGWYTDEEASEPFVLGTTITEDITLYAGWTVTGIVHPVKLEASIKTPTIYVGDTLDEEDLTVKVTYSDKSTAEVTGFTSDILTINTLEEGTKYITVSYSESGVTLETGVQVRVTLEGLVKTFIVSFDSDNGDDIFTQIIPEGQLAQAPADPVNGDYIFAGWYNGNTKFDFKKAVKANVSLKTRWAYGHIIGDNGLYVYFEDCGNFVYTGSAVTPVPVVMDNNFNVLKNKTDYSISYKNNKSVSDAEKKASFTIKAKGNYSGSIAVEFDILPKNISDEETVAASTTEFVKYNKKGITPVPTVKYGKVALKNKTDYTLSYELLANQDAESGEVVTAPLKESGWYRMVLEGKGNYTGTRELRFRYASSTMVNLANCSISQKSKSYNYTGESIVVNSNVTVKNGKTTLTEGEDYQLIYESDNINPGTVTVAVKELEGNDLYYGVKRFTYTIKGLAVKDASVTLKESKISYNGCLHSDNISDITIRTTSKNKDFISALAGEEYEIGQYYYLVPGQDYEAVYSKALAKGTATVTVTGKGLFTGSIKKTFTINALSIKKDTDKISVTVLNAIQSRAGAVPNVTVTMATEDGEIVLTEGTDYSVKCSSNTNVTEKAKAVISGKGNFKDSVTVYYKVLPKSVKGPGIVIDVPDMLPGKVKAGQAYKPTVKVTDNGKTLKNKSDYTIDYSQALTYEEYQSGTTQGSIIISGTGKSYIGSVKVSYQVAAVNLSDKSVKIAISDMYYTGSAITFDLDRADDKARFTASRTVGEEVTPLVPGVDFEIVSYKSNVKAGTASVTLRGIGDYAGTRTVKFKITKCPLD